tara:strand:- start:2469 stop:2981 length:513 start_codon:yes stop_codon:yes gene_type:complete
MQTLTLGDLKVVADPSGLVVELGGKGGRQVALSSHEAGQLEEFLRRHLPRERRMGFRVRIAPLADALRASFRVVLGSGAAAQTVRPVDLSLTGILVEGQELRLAPGTELPIALDLDGRRCALTGVVVRAQRDLVALHFIECLQRGELAPPEGLLTIYRRLETAWLRSRID